MRVGDYLVPGRVTFPVSSMPSLFIFFVRGSISERKDFERRITIETAFPTISGTFLFNHFITVIILTASNNGFVLVQVPSKFPRASVIIAGAGSEWQSGAVAK